MSNSLPPDEAIATAELERFEEYAIIATVHSRRVSFVVKKIVGTEDNPEGRFLYEIAGASISTDITTVFADGEVFLDGDIQWDGCSNWDFHTGECMAHFCGKRDATSIGRLMDRMYEITKSRLPTFDTEIDG